jgi:iron complex transport system substrate-binding protein
VKLQFFLLWCGLASLLAAMSCSDSKADAPFAFHDAQRPQYAQNFAWNQHGELWDLAVWGHDTSRLLFVPHKALVPDSLGHIRQVRWPVERLVVLTAPSWGHLLHLDQQSALVGLSRKSHAVDPWIRSQVESGRIVEMGDPSEADLEALLALRPGLVIASAGAETRQLAERLAPLGIPVLAVGDYLEEHPLGRAEWLRVIGRVVGQQSRADAFFAQVAQNYLRYVVPHDTSKARPKVIWGSPYMGSWYIAGGKSYAARLIQDAGGDYLYASENQTAASPHDIESVMQKAREADVWLNPDFTKISEAKSQESRLSQLDFIANPKPGRIWRHDLGVNTEGLLPSFERGPGRPDLVLRDLQWILSRSVPHKDSLTFYREIQ